MRKILPLAMLSLAALTGCTAYYTERGAQAMINPSSANGPVYKTDWEVSPKRTKAEGTARVLFWVFTSGEPKYAEVPGLNLGFFPTDRAIYKAKAAATYEACTKNNADALLGVTYNYKITDYFFVSTVECEVQGFPAKVSGVSILEDKPVLVDKDKTLIRLKTYETPEDYSSNATPPKKCGLLGGLL